MSDRRQRQVERRGGPMPDERIVVGGLSVVVPAAWTPQAEVAGEGGRGWVLSDPTGEAVLLLQPARLTRGASLEEKLRLAARPVAERFQAQVGAPRRAAVGQVPALVALLGTAQGALGLVAAVVAGADVVVVIAGWTSKATAQTVDAVLATARGAFPPRQVPPPAGEPAALTIAGADVIYPAAWRVLPSGPDAFVGPAQARFAVPVTVPGAPAPVSFDVLVEVQPGAPVAPRAGIAAWVRDAVERLGRSWGPDAKVTVAAAEDFTFGDGTLGATIVVQERDGEPKTGVVAHVRTSRAMTVWAAVVGGPWTEGWKAAPAGVSARLWERLDEVARTLLAALACVRPRPLPALRPDVVERLAARGRWERRHRWSVVSGSGQFMNSASGSDRVAWTFGRDGTCLREAEDTAGFMTSGPDLRPGHTGVGWTGSGVLDDPGVRRPGRWEVRAPVAEGGPLLLVAEEPNGRTRIHGLELEKAGEYGPSKFVGMAIDGQIDGVYQSGSSDRGAYHYREDSGR